MTVVTDGEESAYRDELQNLAVWCSTNNLLLNTFFKESNKNHQPLSINDVEIVYSFKCLGVHISACLIRSSNTSEIVQKIVKYLVDSEKNPFEFSGDEVFI